ncbi:MAG: hypothetical protein U0R79_08120 [Propionicimonas sp.]
MPESWKRKVGPSSSLPGLPEEYAWWKVGARALLAMRRGEQQAVFAPLGVLLEVFLIASPMWGGRRPRTLSAFGAATIFCPSTH